MKKKKESQNYLDFIPVKNEAISWDTNKAGIVTLHVENKGVFHKLAQVLFHKPKVSHVHLDSLGSFVWPLIDGKKSVYDLGEDIKSSYQENAEPLYPRLIKYLQILESYEFVAVNKV